MATKNSNIGWSGIQTIGIVVVVLGAALSAYSIYSLVSVPLFRAVPQSGFQTNRNYTGNFTGRFPRDSAIGFLPLAEFGSVLSGILMILLGIVTFKYGGLKKMVKIGK